jgi:NADP-dependent 3-hydroxy acid dehydrogenase YdfG
MANVTSVFHHSPYEAISPSSPHNSQSGKTVLITGSTSGIGLATAQAFITAGAGRVIILSRQESLLTSAIQTLENSKPASSSTQILGREVFINDSESVKKLWRDLKETGIEVDILVLNAAKTGQSPILSMGSSHTWNYFETNVLSSLRMTEQFMQQGSSESKVGRSLSIFRERAVLIEIR